MNDSRPSILKKAREMYNKADSFNYEHTKAIREKLADEIDKAASSGKYEIEVETDSLDDYVSIKLAEYGYKLKTNDRSFGKTIISWNI